MTPHIPEGTTGRFKGLNELAFDAAGKLYFTDQGETGLHDQTGRAALAPEG